MIPSRVAAPYQVDLEDSRDIAYQSLPGQQLPLSIDLRGTGAAVPPPYTSPQDGGTAACAVATIFGFEVYRQNPREAFIPSPGELEGASSEALSLRDCLKMLAKESGPADSGGIDIHNYERVPQELQAIRGCLAEGHPLVCTIRIHAGDESGLIALPPDDEPQEELTAITIIGYDDEREVFLFRNSMGAEWGDGGDGRVPYEYLLSPKLSCDFWMIRGVRTSRRTTLRETARENPVLRAPDTELRPKSVVKFEGARGTCQGEMSQPVAAPSAGVIVTSDYSAVYVARIANPGTNAWTIPAKTMVFGWAIEGSTLYVVDGPEISTWNLLNGTRLTAIALAKYTAAELKVMADWKAAIQYAEWATLLEQAEREWPAISAEQNAAAAGSAERDRLDAFTAQYFAMLQGLRKMCGANPTSSSASAARIASLRADLETRRTAGALLRFSAPVVVRQLLERPENAVFVMQSNGSLHVINKPGNASFVKSLGTSAEPVVTVLESGSRPLVAVVGGPKIRTFAVADLAETGSWTIPGQPQLKQHSLSAGSGQIWWGTEAGVYALKPDAGGSLQVTFQSGAPGWTTRQVSRLGPVKTALMVYAGRNSVSDEDFDPTEIYEAMNVNTWLEEFAGKRLPLNDGVLAHGMLADDGGKYTGPAKGVSYLVHGPFTRSGSDATSDWTGFRVHARNGMVLLNDNRGVGAMFDARPKPFPGIPRWTTAPWMAYPRTGDDRNALQAPFPTPTIRDLASTRPKPNMPELLKNIIPRVNEYASASWFAGTKVANQTDQVFRFFLWLGLHGKRWGNMREESVAELQAALKVLYTEAELSALKQHFGSSIGAWNAPRLDVAGPWYDTGARVWHGYAWPVTHPPREWTPPQGRFIGRVPPWYDPWGYNNPEDYFPQKPSRTYFDPFCMDGVRFPQRPAQLGKAAKVQSWAVFTSGDTAATGSSLDPSTTPRALVASFDEDRGRTSLQILSCESKPRPVTYDAATGQFEDTTQIGFFRAILAAAPTVFALDNPADPLPTAYCAVHPLHPGLRVRALLSEDSGTSEWSQFLTANSAKYKQADGSWKLGECALPEVAAPGVEIHGYALPLPQKSVTLLTLPPVEEPRTNLLRDLQPEWRSEIPGTLQSPPLSAGDRVVGVDATTIFALDLYTGQSVKTRGGFPYRLTASFGSAPPQPVHWSGSLYFPDRGQLVALQLSDGRPKPGWTPPALQQVVGVNAARSVIVVTETESATGKTLTTGFDSATGANKWGPVEISERSPGPVAASDSAIFFVADGKLFGRNVQFGDKRFNFDPASLQMPPLSETYSPAIGMLGANGVVVCTGKQVFGLDQITGAVLWTQEPAEPSEGTQWFRPVISEAFNRVVVANLAGEITALELTTGKRLWWDRLADAAQPSIVSEQVYVGERSNRRTLHTYRLIGSAANRQAPASYPLDRDLAYEVTGANGLAAVPLRGELRAIPAGSQKAALFDGKDAAISVLADGAQFDFGTGEFTVEAWLSTTRGGEVLSGTPTAEGNHHGFRVNVTDQGELRFAVTNAIDNVFAAHTGPTRLADGSWHHLAVARKGNSVEVYVDGISRTATSLRNGLGALAIGGKTALTVGACVERPGEPGKAHFAGLMRDVRLWSTALDAPRIQSRMNRALTGLEPQLLGYWQLNSGDISAPANEVPRHALRASSVGKLRSFIADLKLDTSAYPYLLEEARPQWPYSGHWAARGAHDVTSAATVAEGGVICFVAANALYGVHASDGLRAWGVDMPYGVSAPRASQDRVYVLSGDRGALSIDSVSGRVEDIRAFDGLLTTTAHNTPLAAPAVASGYLAAASPRGDLWIVDRAKTDDAVWKTRVDANPGDLRFVDGCVYTVAGAKLHSLDAAKRTVQSTSVAGESFVAHAGRVVLMCTRDMLISVAADDLHGTVGASFRIPAGVQVSGMAASKDADLLVVTTRQGTIYGLSFSTMAVNWTAQSADSTPVLEPTIAGRDVFCTSTGGAVEVFDAASGELRGRYRAPNGAATPPVVYAGGVYFGSPEAPPSAQVRDGAMHSVVFGKTYALRTGVDAEGAAEPPARCGYVQSVSQETLTLLDSGICTVEAWINSLQGGQILSLSSRPEQDSDEDTPYTLSLSVAADGKIHFTCADQTGGGDAAWQKVEATAATAGPGGSYACDGKWHHIAISRVERNRVAIYFDGALVQSTSTYGAMAAAVRPAAGARVTIGADASGTEPSNFFRGMIAEVRLWETHLAASRIAERMHHKFADQPGLLAYWDFDTRAAHDQGPRLHHGKLERRGSAAGFWLSDLNFTRPQYPQIETSGSRQQEGSPGGDASLADTVYQLTVRAKKADGSPLAGQPISLWYVRHKGEGGPERFRISAPGKAEQEIGFVRPNHGSEDSFTTTTGADGKVVLTMRSPAFSHGPAIDLRAGFMSENERRHINILLDDQNLEQAPQPRLEAQSKLIQDYHYSPGGQVDEKRDRSTYRTVLRTLHPDGTARAGERIQIWAAEQTEIEVNGRKYTVTPQNCETFFADAAGEVTVVASASNLQEPPLSVWAGFMHRDERCLLQPGQDAHKKLSTLSAEDLKENRRVNWKPDSSYPDGKFDPKRDTETLIDKEYEQNAGQVAGAVSRVMSVTQPAPNPPQAGRRSRRPLRSVDHLVTVRPATQADSVQMISTLRHISRHAPIEPKNFTVPDLLGSASSTRGGSAGFLIGPAAGGGIQLTPLSSAADLPEEMRMPRGPQPMVKFSPQQLGGFFDFVEDAWNAVKDAVVDAANAVAEAAQRVAVFIEDQVNIVIEFANRVVHAVVDTVQQAVAAVVRIFEIIKAAIEKVIAFLRMLFDWGAILEVKNIVQAAIKTQLGAARDLPVNQLIAPFEEMADKVASAISLPGCGYSRSAGAAQSEREDPALKEQFEGVQGKYAISKANESPDRVGFNGAMVTAGGGAIDLTANPIEVLSSAITQLANNPFALSLSDLLATFEDLMKVDLKSMVRRGLISAFDGLQTAIGAILDLVTTRINIPFLSELYEFITGSPLTLLDLACLAISIPLHIGYSLYMLAVHGTATTFARDAGGVRRMTESMNRGGNWDFMSAAPRLEASAEQDALSSDSTEVVPRSIAWTYCGVSVLSAITSLYVGKVKHASYVAGREGGPTSGYEKLLFAVNSALAVAGRSIFLFGITIPQVKAEQARVAAGGDPDSRQLLDLLDSRSFQMTLFSLTVASEAIVLWRGWNPEIDRARITKGDVAMLMISMFGLGLFITRIHHIIASQREREPSAAMIVCYTADLMSSLGVVLMFTGTRYFARSQSRAALTLNTVRAAFSGIVPILQLVAYEIS